MLDQFLDKVIQFVDIGSYIVKRALDETEAVQRQRQKAQEVSKATLQKLARAGLIAEHQVKQARRILNSHADSLHLINSLTDRIVELRRAGQPQKRAHDLGRAEGPSRPASYFAGRSRELRPSDLVLLQVLNGSH